MATPLADHDLQANQFGFIPLEGDLVSFLVRFIILMDVDLAKEIVSRGI